MRSPALRLGQTALFSSPWSDWPGCWPAGPCAVTCRGQSQLAFQGNCNFHRRSLPEAGLLDRVRAASVPHGAATPCAPCAVEYHTSLLRKLRQQPAHSNMDYHFSDHNTSLEEAEVTLAKSYQVRLFPH